MLKVIKIFNFQELVLYLLQLVQALRYENFKKTAKGSTVQITAATQQNKETKLPNNTQNNNSSDNINRTNINTDATGTQQQNMFDLNLKTFLINRAKSNEIVADCLYWYVKVEMGDKLGEQDIKTNFHLFMDELIDSLQNVSKSILLNKIFFYLFNFLIFQG